MKIIELFEVELFCGFTLTGALSFILFALFIILITTGIKTNAYAFNRKGLDETIILASKKYDVPLPFLIAVMRAESGFNINALSPKGAVGLMQVMPKTGRELSMDIQNPPYNIIAGVKYLHYCLKRFGYKPVPALACYNAGPGSVRTVYVKNRPEFLIPPYRQTDLYILRVFRYYNYYRKMLK